MSSVLELVKSGVGVTMGGRVLPRLEQERVEILQEKYDLFSRLPNFTTTVSAVSSVRIKDEYSRLAAKLTLVGNRNIIAI